MFAAFKLLDTISLHATINVRNAVAVSKANQYCLLVEDGFYILQLCGFMNNIAATCSLKKAFFKLPEYVPSDHFDININSFIHYLPQFELYEAVLRIDISENLSHASLTPAQPIKAEWSPQGLVTYDNCALAILTNTGFLTIFVRTVNQVEIERFISIANITEMCIKHFKPNWNVLDNRPSPGTMLEELKKRAASLPTSFTWSDLYTKCEKYCVLFVGHLDGSVTLWKVNQREFNDATKSDGITFLAFHATELERITSLHWSRHNYDDGLLLLGDLKGRVLKLRVNFSRQKEVQFDKELYLWDERDLIEVQSIKTYTSDGLYYIFVIKGSFLMIFLINNVEEVLGVYKFPSGDVSIIDITRYYEDRFILMTSTGLFKELQIKSSENQLSVTLCTLHLDYKWSSNQTRGLIISPNRIFFAVVLNVIDLIRIRKRSECLVKLLIYGNPEKKPLDVLKTVTTDIGTYWDCLEILRLVSSTEKKCSYKQLPKGADYDSLSLAQLKIFYWFSKSYEITLSKLSRIVATNFLPSDDLLEIIKIKLEVKHALHLIDLLGNGKKLDDFHLQSLDVANMYLKEVVGNDSVPRLGFGKCIIESLFGVIKITNQIYYPPLPVCKWCNKKLSGLYCTPPHVDNRCNISLMPITDLPYLKCPFCNCVVHQKMTEVYDVVACPYCDVTMDLVGYVTDPESISEIKTNKDESVDGTRAQEATAIEVGETISYVTDSKSIPEIKTDIEKKCGS